MLYAQQEVEKGKAEAFVVSARRYGRVVDTYLAYGLFNLR